MLSKPRLLFDPPRNLSFKFIDPHTPSETHEMLPYLHDSDIHPRPFLYEWDLSETASDSHSEFYSLPPPFFYDAYPSTNTEDL